MNKEDILTYLSKQQKRTKKVKQLEQILNKKQNINLQMKQKWKKTIYSSLIVAILIRLMYYPYYDLFGFTTFLFILGTGLFLIKKPKVQESSNEVQEAEQLLEKEMSKTEYLDGLQDFPIKFYDYDSIYRLYQLVKENRATTLHDSFNLLENQLNVEYQNHLAEQNLLTTQATERSARIAAVSSVVTAYNTLKK